jgi:hypothetical protein
MSAANEASEAKHVRAHVTVLALSFRFRMAQPVPRRLHIAVVRRLVLTALHAAG